MSLEPGIIDPQANGKSVTTPIQYDYIFTGSGCAALSLLMRLINSGQLEGKKVLLIDKSDKKENDRTWCFWEKQDGFFESIVYHSWSGLNIYGSGYGENHVLAPYRYKMIRGIDFYDHCLAEIRKHKNITTIHAEVTEIGNRDGSAFVSAGDNTYYGEYLFNSVLFKKQVPKANEYFLLQHFKGFLIRRTDLNNVGTNDGFDPATGTLMDFRISQEHGTAFVYVLPVSSTDALVEYTLFTPSLLPDEAYDKVVHQYIRDILDISSYEILSTEFGVIPMTNIPFPAYEGKIINIGTAGGQTKPSTGYTFSFIQKQAAFIATQLKQGKFPVAPKTLSARKFLWYDSILLNVLSSGKLPGDQVFTQLFRKNHITEVFRFLDNESTLIQDLKVISSLPTWPFAKAAFEATKPPGSAVLHS